ncbi:MAG: glycosyltransferase [Candidatus Scalindua sediminis]|nr:glycosyltransferase [Candidatus Scalindua sediminis]
MNTNNPKSEIVNPTLSLCMIVKNEEKLLPRCLESVKDHVDEIIIVDTGSTDKTVEIAKSYNAKIYHHAWENSFSKARNYSLKYATCEWILILDADEEIDKEDAHKLKDVIPARRPAGEKDPAGCETTHPGLDQAWAGRVNVIYLPIISRPVGGKNISIANSERLFKNHLGFRYEGIVHNALKQSGLAKKVNIKIYHYGYNLDEVQKEKKFIRTSTLLREQIKKDPKNPISHHYLALAYLGRKMYDCCAREALEAIRLFEQQNSNAQIRLLTYYMAGAAFYHKKDLANAEAYALKAIDLYPDYVDAYCILSSIYFQRREYSRCTEATKKYLRLLRTIESNPTKALIIPYNTLHHAWSAHSRMAIVYYEQDNEHEGIQSLNNAISRANNKWEPYLAIGEYFLEQKNLKLAERFLKEGLKNSPHNKKLLLNLGRLYYLKNDLKMTEASYKKALEIDAGYIDALKGMGTLYLDMKKFEEARIFLYKVLQKVKDVEVYNNLGCLEDKEGLYERAKFFFGKALELEPESQVIMNNLKNIQKKLSKEGENPPCGVVYATPQGSISLCMIVRNEVENLARCLNSVKDTVDEIIIVDTGSTDRTVEIAKSFGAKIYFHPWENSFSKARNYSLKYATCEWILILDADEELSKDGAPRLKEIIKNNNYETISFVVKNKYKDSTQESYANMIRLFKNFNGTYYEGTVHNIIKCRGKRLDSSLSITHHGYNLSEEEMEEKFMRTTTLLKEQIKTDPHNPVPHMYLGVSYLGNNIYDEAIAESKKALELAKKKKFTLRDFLVSYYVVSAAYLKKGNSKESEKYALKSIEIDDQFIDGFCILSFIYYDSKEYGRFLQTSENYLNSWDSITTHPGKSNTFTSHTIGHKWKIHLLRGFYYLSSGQDERGNTEVDTALKESTEIEDCLKLLGNYYMENNNLDKAEETYKKLLHTNETAVDVLVKMGHVKFRKRDLQETVLFWKKAVAIEPTLFDIRLLICKVNIVQGKFEDVIADCDRLLHILSIPGNITLEDLSDLAKLFNVIGEKLKEKYDAQAAETAFNICKDLKHIQSMDIANV